MPLKNTLESRISYRIRRSKAHVFMREDFSDIGGYDQVGRILRNLVKKECLISIGYGAYARTRKSSINGNYIPDKPIADLARELLKKLGIKTSPSKADTAYNEGISTQVPTGRVIGVKGRVARKIEYNGVSIAYERCA
tara:strand:- start:421 stop:834 length:414 start_codon:yes stop_codon:yes gene_type:complete